MGSTLALRNRESVMVKLHRSSSLRGAGGIEKNTGLDSEFLGNDEIKRKSGAVSYARSSSDRARITCHMQPLHKRAIAHTVAVSSCSPHPHSYPWQPSTSKRIVGLLSPHIALHETLHDQLRSCGHHVPYSRFARAQVCMHYSTTA